MKRLNSIKITLRGPKSGFSLIEILIALALLVTAGAFVATNVFDNLQEGKVNSTKIQMQGLGSVLEEYRIKCNEYPETLDALINPPESCEAAPRNGFFQKADEIPNDAWGTPFEYQKKSRREYVLVSLGADEEPGGQDIEADICSFSGNVKNCEENEGEQDL
jgi:general secretion pathway protein G